MRTVFWNVDTQYDFMRDDESFKGALPVPNAREIEPALERLTKLAKEKNIRVVNTGDWHTENSPEISGNPDFITTFPPHCLQHTKGAEYVPATKPESPYVIDWQTKDFDEGKVREHRNIVIYKDRFDVFEGSPHTERVLRILGPEQAVVYGVALNVCVDCAVRGLLRRGIRAVVVMDAVKELPNIPKEEIIAGWLDKGAALAVSGDKEQETAIAGTRVVAKPVAYFL